MKEINDLIKESLPILETYAGNFTINSYEADDLLNETVLKVLENKDSYKSGTNFIGWCVTIMKHININKYGYEKIRQTEDIDDYKEFGNCAVNNEYEEEICKNFIKDNLTKKQAECFLLLYEGYDYDTISKMLAIPIGTVKSRINSSRSILKTLINE